MGKTCKLLSSVLTTQSRTHRVMISGTKTSKPANNHLRKAVMSPAQLVEVGVLGVLGAAAVLSPPLDAPPRKSVTYQPEPLSWKPAAVRRFLKVEAPQAGQSVRGASEIFCNTSLAWPQDSH
jgi:hypothetical protein